MQSRSGVAALGVISVIVVIFTLAAFFLLDIERIALFIWSLIFLLISECVMFGGLIGLRLSAPKSSGVFLKSGVTSALCLYFAATLVCALCSGFFRDRLTTFICVELGIVVLFAVITIAILSFSGRVERNNEEDAKKVGSNEPKRGGF